MNPLSLDDKVIQVFFFVLLRSVPCKINLIVNVVDSLPSKSMSDFPPIYIHAQDFIFYAFPAFNR